MSFVCDRVGLENVLLGFDLYKCPCFSIWQSKDLKFTFVSDDINEAREVLEQNLQGLHDSSTALYKIKFYKEPSKGKEDIDRSTPETGSFTFRMSTGEAYRNNLPTERADSGVAQLVALLKEQQVQHAAQMQEMKESIAQINGVEYEDVNPLDDTIIGQIGTAVERYPALKELAERGFTFLERLADKLTSPNNSNSDRNYNTETYASKQVAGVSIPMEMQGNEKITAVIHEMIKAETPAESAKKLELLAEALRILVERDSDFLNSLIGLSKLTSVKYNMAKSFL